MEQSPVDIADAPVNPDDVAYAYQDTAVNIVNNGHAIQVNYDEGSIGRDRRYGVCAAAVPFPQSQRTHRGWCKR